MIRSFLGVVLLSVLACGPLAGCTPDQHQKAADGTEAVKTFVDDARKMLSSDVAKGIADAVGKIPIPAAQAIPVARDKVEWGLGIASGLLGLIAAWQARKAQQERSKKKAYKANCPKLGLDAANQEIYGDAFKAELSK